MNKWDVIESWDKMLLSIGLGLLILFILILLSKIHIAIHYTYDQDSHHMVIALFVLRIKCYKKEIDLRESDNNQLKIAEMDFKTFYGVIKSLYRHVKNGDSWINHLLNKFQILHFNWITQGGTGNAVSCGIVSGGLWAVKGMMIALLNEKIQLKCKPSIHVEPNFQQQFLQTEFDCMVSIRFGQAIYALIKIIKDINKQTETSSA